jgi:transmembrane sensor
MTAETPEPIATSAILWHIRLRDGDDAAWADFVEWLAEDPRHGAAYDRIEAADQALDPLLPDLVFRAAANDEAPDAPGEDTPRRHLWRRGAAVGGLLAASLAAVLLFGPLIASTRYDAVTGPGEHRQIALDANTTITLNGATRITLDRKDKRFAALVTGEALFQVRHDAAHPFTLALGKQRVVDIGTLFDVVRDSGGVRLAVAEGKVAYRPDGASDDGQSVPVAAGQALSDTADGDTIRVTDAPAGSVGGWRKSRLVYAAAPLAEVAADIARTLGLRITVAPAIARRPVSGSIALAGRGAAEARRLGAVLDVTIVTGRDGWMIEPLRSDAH